MTATQHELDTLANGLNADHGAMVMALACLVHLTRRMFCQIGDKHDASLLPLLVLQRRVVNFWLQAHDLPEADLDQAVAGLERSADVVATLASVPD